MKKEVYRIGPRGEFAGVTVLDEGDIDPKGKGWLLPAGCVETPPPLQKEGFDIYWNGMEWIQIPAFKQDKSAERARQKRNAMLAETDWTQLSDVPKATRDKWKRYRQKLRDITEQMGFPVAIDWPEKPDC